jgi:acid phosphatase
LNKFLQGYEFTDADVYTLYEICAYEDAVTGATSQLSVPLYAADCSCELFTPLEFLAFEYLDDIWFQQFDGPANKFSAILG